MLSGEGMCSAKGIMWSRFTSPTKYFDAGAVAGQAVRRSRAFRIAARRILAEAQSQKGLLVRHGLLGESVDKVTKSVDQFEQALEAAADARRNHVGASAQLDAVPEGHPSFSSDSRHFHDLRPSLS